MGKRLNPAEEATRLFSEQLRAARKLKGFRTATDAAKALGMSEPETYRRWERGETEPGIAALIKIRETFGVSLDTLIIQPARSGGYAPTLGDLKHALRPGR